MTGLTWKQGILWGLGIGTVIAILAVFAHAQDEPPEIPGPDRDRLLRIDRDIAVAQAQPLPSPQRPDPTPAVPIVAQADTAPTAAPNPPAATIHLVVPPAAPAPPTTVQLHVSAATAPAPAATALPVIGPGGATPIAAELRSAGPVRRAIGALGDRLSRVGYDHVLVPRASPAPAPAQAIVYQVVVPATPTPPAAQAVMASPQAPTKSSSLFRR